MSDIISPYTYSVYNDSNDQGRNFLINKQGLFQREEPHLDSISTSGLSGVSGTNRILDGKLMIEGFNNYVRTEAITNCINNDCTLDQLKASYKAALDEYNRISEEYKTELTKLLTANNKIYKYRGHRVTDSTTNKKYFLNTYGVLREMTISQGDCNGSSEVSGTDDIRKIFNKAVSGQKYENGEPCNSLANTIVKNGMDYYYIDPKGEKHRFHNPSNESENTYDLVSAMNVCPSNITESSNFNIMNLSDGDHINKSNARQICDPINFFSQSQNTETRQTSLIQHIQNEIKRVNSDLQSLSNKYTTAINNELNRSSTLSESSSDIQTDIKSSIVELKNKSNNMRSKMSELRGFKTKYEEDTRLSTSSYLKYLTLGIGFVGISYIAAKQFIDK